MFHVGPKNYHFKVVFLSQNKKCAHMWPNVQKLPEAILLREKVNLSDFCVHEFQVYVRLNTCMTTLLHAVLKSHHDMIRMLHSIDKSLWRAKHENRWIVLTFIRTKETRTILIEEILSIEVIIDILIKDVLSQLVTRDELSVKGRALSFQNLDNMEISDSIAEEAASCCQQNLGRRFRDVAFKTPRFLNFPWMDPDHELNEI